MKSINRKDFIIAGVVEKIHGTKGGLRLSFDQKIKIKEWVFFEFHQKPVPFFVESISGNDVDLIVQVKGISTPKEAQRFVGKTVLVPSSKTKRKTRTTDLSIIDYLLIDENIGELGRVEDVEELPQQLIIRTTFKGKELLIPAVDEFIIEINEKKKIIHLNLPEGILEL